ncbi:MULTISPECIES: MlaE family lipid ABC transporter permease subunit [Bradyrhizobium]|uniref:MlaE family ABC transporter permease n=1 Tax=Bradyrhizobium elkanii TaxID=29448 RepID=UPI0004820FE6
MNSAPDLTMDDGAVRSLHPRGAWTVANVEILERLCAGIQPRLAQGIRKIDLSGITALDTVGAWLIEKLARGGTTQASEAEITGLSASYSGLIGEVRKLNRRPPAPARRTNALADLLERVGRGVIAETMVFLDMLGSVGIALFRTMRHPRSFRFTSTVYQLGQVGWRAIPIMVLITFLIGAIIAQQGIFHFRKFGADSYVVDMVGILVLRELGVLIVAIMVAGRSGSAYTAEIGSMKMREEIDALTTMGLDPVEVLILPRVLALVIALPILTFLGSMAALYGGGLVTWLYGGMGPAIFIARLHEAVSINSFEVGMIKAPFMALVIGLIAASEGLRVKGSAESLGQQTTSSVVKSIFLVIVLDGLFAVFFASIGM